MPYNLPAITATSDELIVWIESYAGAQDSSQLAVAVQKAHDRQQRNLTYYRAQYCSDTTGSYRSLEQQHITNHQPRFDHVIFCLEDLTSFVDYYGISVDIVDRVGLSAAARLAAKREFAAAMRLVHNHGANVDNVALGAVLAGDQGMAWQLFDKYDASLKAISYGAGWVNDADFIDFLIQRCSSGEDVSVCTANVNSIFTGAIHGAAFMGHEQLLTDLWQRHKPQMHRRTIQHVWRGRHTGIDSVARERVEAGDLSAINSASEAERVGNIGLSALGDFQLIKQMGWLNTGWLNTINRFKAIIYHAALHGRYALIHDLLEYFDNNDSKSRFEENISGGSLFTIGLASAGNLNQIMYLSKLYYKDIRHVSDIAWLLNRTLNWRLLKKLNQWCGQNYLTHLGQFQEEFIVFAYKEKPDIIKQLTTCCRDNCYVNGFKQIPHFFGIVNDRILRQRFLAHYPEHNITEHNTSRASKIKHQFKQCFYPDNPADNPADNTASYQHPFSNAQIRQIKMIDRLHQAYGFSTDESLFFLYNCNQPLSLVAWFQSLYKPLSDCKQPLSLVAWFQSLYRPLSEGRYDRKQKLFPEDKQPLSWPFEVQVHILSFCMASPWPWQSDEILLYHLGDKLRQKLPRGLPADQAQPSKSASLRPASADDGSQLVKRETGPLVNSKRVGQLLWEFLRSIFFATPQTQTKLNEDTPSSITELSQTNNQKNDASHQTVSDDSNSSSLSQCSASSSTDESSPQHMVSEHKLANESKALYTTGIDASWWSDHQHEPLKPSSLKRVQH